MKPKLLDLFCGAGGASMGYYCAGFEVTGIDIKPQPRYPFRFIQGDALNPPVDLSKFDVIHASPPCQDYSSLREVHKNNRKSERKPKLINQVRKILEATGRFWIIENVETSPLLKAPSLFGGYGVVLCGTSFGLDIYRHRIFETSFPTRNLPYAHHPTKYVFCPYDSDSRKRFEFEMGSLKEYARLMGVEWMRKEATEAIPPAYTEFIGKQLLTFLESPKVASPPPQPPE